MAKYRKKPVIIEAAQYAGAGNFHDGPALPGWIWDGFESGALFNRQGTLVVKTLEGEHIASPGDYIIRGIQGELYPCKPDIFEQTYEPA